jgi:hypothetical protein
LLSLGKGNQAVDDIECLTPNPPVSDFEQVMITLSSNLNYQHALPVLKNLHQKLVTWLVCWRAR